jgi:hypothetical protein
VHRYQEYKPEGPPVSKGVAAISNASHVDLPRIYWQTENSAGEYDIPPAFWVEGKDPKIVGYPEVGPYPELTPGSSCTGNCPSGDDCECIHTITYNNTVSNMRLIYAGGHCHAPACIGIWLYRNDPGHEMVSRAFPSWNRTISTEIYLCHACFYHEFEDGNARAGADVPPGAHL